MNLSSGLETILHTKRYSYLLATLIVFVGVYAALGQAERASGRLLDATFLGVLVVALVAAGERRMGARRVLALAAIFAAVHVGLRAAARSEMRGAAAVLLLGFFVLVTVALLADVLRNRRLALGERIRGAICVYFLLGLSWAIAYGAIEWRGPGSFSGLSAEAERRGTELVYYSFVTLTTVGYGDIAPKSDLARTLAWLEAFTGQMYVAITIARLVSLREGGGDGAP